MRIDHPDAHEPEHAASHTDQIIASLELYGYSPNRDEPDPRPLPEDETISGAVTEIFDALIGALGETCLEPELEDVLWSVRGQIIWDQWRFDLVEALAHLVRDFTQWRCDGASGAVGLCGV